MLIRKTTKNQVVIPKALIKRAGLDNQQVPFFEVSYQNGGFFLRPMKATAVQSDLELFQLFDKLERQAKTLGLTEADVAREVKAYRKAKAARKAA